MKKLKKYLNALAATRTRLGLTQEQMAIHMDMSLSKVKLVETERRNLSSDKLLKLAALEIELAKFATEMKDKLSASAEYINKHAEISYKLETEYQVSRCTFMSGKLEKRLRKMKIEYAKVTAALYNLDKIPGIKRVRDL